MRAQCSETYVKKSDILILFCLTKFSFQFSVIFANLIQKRYPITSWFGVSIQNYTGAGGVPQQGVGGEGGEAQKQNLQLSKKICISFLHTFLKTQFGHFWREEGGITRLDYFTYHHNECEKRAR